MARYIKKIGIELEVGTFYDENGNVPTFNKFNVTHDGSINTTGLSAETAREYVSVPVSFKSDWENPEMRELEDSIYELYNHAGVEVNSSMGLHVHVSFYQDFFKTALFCKEFNELLLQKVKESELYDKYDTLHERMDGERRYAKPVTNESMQNSLDSAGASRYRHFTNRSQTVEFRLFPAMKTHKEVKRAVQIITESINSFLYSKDYELEAVEELKLESKDKIPDTQNPSKQDLEEVIEYV